MTAAAPSSLRARLLALVGAMPTLVLALFLAASSAVTSVAQQRQGPPAAPRGGQSGPLEVDITQGTLKPIPIAVPEFGGEDAQFGREIADVVAADLERSGLFQPLDRAAFIGSRTGA
jgi:TolB protein